MYCIIFFNELTLKLFIVIIKVNELRPGISVRYLCMFLSTVSKHIPFRMYSPFSPYASKDTNCMKCSISILSHISFTIEKYLSPNSFLGGQKLDVTLRCKSSFGLSNTYWKTLYVFLSIIGSPPVILKCLSFGYRSGHHFQNAST